MITTQSKIYSYLSMQVELIVPNSLSEITIGQYQEFLTIKEKNEGKNNEINDFIIQKMISIFCNVKMNYVAMMKLSDVTDIFSTLNKIFEEQPKHELKFNLGNTDFGFLPNIEESKSDKKKGKKGKKKQEEDEEEED